jgi:hypothetical protein
MAMEMGYLPAFKVSDSAIQTARGRGSHAAIALDMLPEITEMVFWMESGLDTRTTQYIWDHIGLMASGHLPVMDFLQQIQTFHEESGLLD